MKPKKNTDNIKLLKDIRHIISQARALTRRNVNSLHVISNYLIGMRIVKEEQSGNKRAEYGKETLKQLSIELTKEFGRGYSHSNLENMRKFYLTYMPMIKQKTQTLSAFSEIGKSQTVSGISKNAKSQTPFGFFENFDIDRDLTVQTATEKYHIVS